MSARSPSTIRLAVVLTAFFLTGSGMTLVIWHTLSDFLAGKPVEGGRYLLALALAGIFAGVAWLLARYIESVLPLDR